MKRVVFATPNQGRREEVQRLLADLNVEWSRLGPAVPPGLDLEGAARFRSRAVFRETGQPSFVENTALYLDGVGERRGSVVKAHIAAIGENAFCLENAGRRGQLRVVVALAEGDSDADVTVFQGSTAVTVAAEPRGAEGWGWDRVLLLDGYHRTLAELGNSRYLVNMRHGPYLDLADHLRGQSTSGAFEAHVTVRAATDALPLFREACDAIGVKCVLIELPQGVISAQPMTASVHRGSLRDVQEEVHNMGRELLARGFEVIRTKIEALPRNGEIPLTNESAAQRPAGYFEYHIKVSLPDGDEQARAAVNSAVASFGAHLSRNANARRRPGEEDRFITLRVPGVGQPEAEARFQALLSAVEALPYPIRSRVREYTVYDSDVNVDRGWG
ncbi:MAG: hypothetical protein IPK82_07800 [Polyangiaceae bacterium]|nr:hypothetical protein [Polyangiaceae bacterium]